jgi:hypothetical protein
MLKELKERQVMTLEKIFEDYNQYIEELSTQGNKEAADKIKYLLLLVKYMDLSNSSMNKIIKRLQKEKVQI